jgi:hypothetical protein
VEVLASREPIGVRGGKIFTQRRKGRKGRLDLAMKPAGQILLMTRVGRRAPSMGKLPLIVIIYQDKRITDPYTRA